MPPRPTDPAPWHTHVDIIYYINLDRRDDRKTQFLEEMQRVHCPPHKLVRIPGVDTPERGAYGCGMSHLAALDHFMQTDPIPQAPQAPQAPRTCLIFEDDFMFTHPDPYEALNHAFHTVFVDPAPPFDVCMLSCQEVDVRPTSHPFLHQVHKAHTTSGYLVSRRFAPTLFDTFLASMALLEQSYEFGQEPHIQHDFNIDQYWCRIQPISQWYVLNPKLGVQRESYSDIIGQNVNYGI